MWLAVQMRDPLRFWKKIDFWTKIPTWRLCDPTPVFCAVVINALLNTLSSGNIINIYCLKFWAPMKKFKNKQTFLIGVLTSYDIPLSTFTFLQRLPVFLWLLFWQDTENFPLCGHFLKTLIVLPLRVNF